MTGVEKEHVNLRRQIAQYIADETERVINSCLDSPAADLVRRHVDKLHCDGEWAGEDVIRATASCLGRDIHVYTAVGHTFPLVYRPDGGAAVASAKAIKIAFYEKGHYKALVSKSVN